MHRKPTDKTSKRRERKEDTEREKRKQQKADEKQKSHKETEQMGHDDNSKVLKHGTLEALFARFR